MELRAYGAVLRRHAWMIGLITLAALIVSVVLAFRGPTAYTATMRLAVSVVPDPRVGDYFKFDSYYSVLTSEYLADDLSELLRSEAFASDVSDELGQTIKPEVIVDLTRTKKTHRLLDIQIASNDYDSALAIAQAYERVIDAKLSEYLAFLQANNGFVRIVNRPKVTRTNSLPLTAAEIGLRTMAGLVGAVGLAFLLEYLDDRLRDRRQVESFLGTKVLAEIPLSP
ncbi:MAG: YveK family protein [Chloroflexota bacterium]